MTQPVTTRKSTRRTTKSSGNGGNGAAVSPPPPATPAPLVDEDPEDEFESYGLTRRVVVQGLLIEARGEGRDSTSSTRVSAWEKLGKLLKMFEDKPEEYSPRVLLG